MTTLEVLLLVILVIALVDKLIDLDHECWRDGCEECAKARRERDEGTDPLHTPGSHGS